MDDPGRDRQRASTASHARPRPLWPRSDIPSEPTSWVVQLAVVLAICFVAMAVATAILRQWRPPAAEAVVGSASAASAAAPGAAASARVTSQFALYDERERQARQIEQQQLEERRAAATREQEAVEAAAKKRAAREVEREREWRATYRKPGYCDESQPTIDSVGCANDYIRARREFDARFNARH